MGCTLKAIVAVCDDWGIGRSGGLLVSNRADMRHFVDCTMGRPVIMGRATLDSFPGGRALKGRRNIVLTRDTSFERAGVETVCSVEEALRAVEGEDEAWVIGGAQVYAQLLDACDAVEVTRNRCVRAADVFFPDLDTSPAWAVASRTCARVIEPGEGDAGVSYEFVTYVRAPCSAQPA